MWMERISTYAALATMPFAPIAQAAGGVDFFSEDAPEIAAPFRPSQSFLISSKEIQSLFLKQQYLAASKAEQSPISFLVENGDRSPSELINEFRQLSGVTWAQVAEVFEVSARAPFDWSAGKHMSAKNHKRLGDAIAALRFIDRGSSYENRNMLLSDAQNGQTYLDLFKLEQFDLVKALAGEGKGRSNFSRKLTEEAIKFNTPTGFGAAIEATIGSGETEIVPSGSPKLRRVKARQKKV